MALGQPCRSLNRLPHDFPSESISYESISYESISYESIPDEPSST
jgi:hypothetical protein